MDTLEYIFEELPLITVGGFAAGLISGKANIAFDASGEWFVREIYLDGYRAGNVPLETRYVEIEKAGSTAHLYSTIWAELTDGSFKDAISDAVASALEEEGFSPRSGASEHSTLNRPQQGV